MRFSAKSRVPWAGAGTGTGDLRTWQDHRGVQRETIFSSRSGIRPRSEARTTLLKSGPTARVAVQDPDQSARAGAHRHEPVWTVAKQRNTFGTHQVHSGQTKKSG